MLSSCLHRNVPHGGAEISPIACTQRCWQLTLLFPAPRLRGSSPVTQTRDPLLPSAEGCWAQGLHRRGVVGSGFCPHAL